MPTQNATITSAWSKIADAADDPVTIQAANPNSPDLSIDQGVIQYELALVDGATAPSVVGLTAYSHKDIPSREALGAGHLYARLIYSSAGSTSVVLVVNGSSLSLS
jgi:hypothetical protein